MLQNNTRTDGRTADNGRPRHDNSSADTAKQSENVLLFPCILCISTYKFTESCFWVYQPNHTWKSYHNAKEMSTLDNKVAIR